MGVIPIIQMDAVLHWRVDRIKWVRYVVVPATVNRASAWERLEYGEQTDGNESNISRHVS